MSTYIVTGAFGGIGAATVEHLLARGHRVVAVDLKEPEFAGPEVVSLALDVTDPGYAVQMLEVATRELGEVDGVHLNAGIMGPGATPFVDLEYSDFDDVFRVNVQGGFVGLRDSIRYFRDRSIAGSIVVTTSIAASHGANRLVPYTASKHALLGLMRAAAVQAAPYGIRVNSVSPSMTLTQMATSISSYDEADAVRAREAFAAQVPLRRLAEPSEMAGAVAFLLSAEASYLSGHDLVVDGGLGALNPLRADA